MKSIFAILGIVAAIGGTLCGILNWFLTEFYLGSVDWQGPMVTVNSALWILNILGIGFGVVLIGIGAMLRESEPSGSGRTEGQV